MKRRQGVNIMSVVQFRTATGTTLEEFKKLTAVFPGQAEHL